MGLGVCVAVNREAEVSKAWKRGHLVVPAECPEEFRMLLGRR